MSRLYQVDAFSAQAFRGNPAGVVVLDEAADADWMQAVAAEINLAETAFVLPPIAGLRPLRWFTPAVEVPLCGHATMATAHVLWQQGDAPADETLHFGTLSGPLAARRDGAQIVLDLPTSVFQPGLLPDLVAEHLGQPVISAAVLEGFAGKDAWLVELADEQAVRDYQVNDAALLSTGIGGLILTARATSTTKTDTAADIVSRVLLPGIGISEDPVTGAAHCALGPYWADKLGRNQLVAYQASPRGGLLGVHVKGERVELSGQAVTVFAGELAV